LKVSILAKKVPCKVAVILFNLTSGVLPTVSRILFFHMLQK
jgi:hypothetical protein